MTNSRREVTGRQTGWVSRRGGTALVILLALCVVALGLELLARAPFGSPLRTTSPVLAIEGPQGGAEANATYSFFPFRRSLWVIRHDTGTVNFFIFPSAEGKPIQPSRPHNIDRNAFPQDQVEYQVSDVNLTSHLWILNPVTGKARYLKALRDGTIEVSDLLQLED